MTQEGFVFRGRNSSDYIEYLRILNDGRVGIGTSSPGYKLTAFNSDLTQVASFESGQPESLLRFSTTGTTKGPQVGGRDDDLLFRTNFERRMTIKADGNVGIGTDEPYSKLTVREQNGTAINLDINSTDTGSYSSIAWTTANLDLGAQPGAEIRGYRTAPGALGELAFHTRGQDYLSTERVRISDAGNVGIGTNAPSTTLELGTETPVLRLNGTTNGSNVYGDIRSTGNGFEFLSRGGSSSFGSYAFYNYDGTTESIALKIKSDGNVGIGTDSPQGELVIRSSTPQIYLEPTSDVQNTRLNFCLTDGSISSAIQAGGKEDGIKFITDGSEKVRFLSNGNVGIGTDAPLNKLEVHGSGDATTTTVNYAEYTASFLTDTAVLSIGSVIGIPCLQSSGSGTSYDLLLNPFQGNVGIGTGSPQQKLDVDGDVKADNFIGDITGDVTGNVTGNADTATKLKTARNINGTAFDGTSAITTAKWGTARNLNGVSVDGSADKTLEPYVERDDGTDANRFLTFVDNNTAGYKRLNMDTNLSYNPSTNKLATSITGDASTLDGINSTSFLRSDADDSASGNLTFNGRTNIRGNLDISDGQNVDFGSSDDVRINYNANNWLYCDFRTSNGLVFRDNGSDKTVLENSGIFRPSANNTGSLGSSTSRWNVGYFTNVDAVGNIKATEKVQAGNDGAGAAALTVNDGAGNCNLTFNHANNSADQTGNAFRISGNTDDTSSATLTFILYENITAGTAGTGANPLKLTKNGAEVNGALKASGFDLESLPALP